jgi:uncharacterized membrane protein
MILRAFSLILLIAPVLSPQRIFFAVRVEPDFRSTEPAKHALRLYQWAVVVIALIGLFWLFVRPENPNALLVGELLLFVVAIGFWLRNYRALIKYQADPLTVASVELTTEPDRLPRYFWASTIPPIILAATALFLYSHWASIPARFPIHWGPDGQPNGWGNRSLREIYGPLLLAGLWMVWLIGMAFASWYGARRSPMRTAIAKIMIAIEFLFGIVFSEISLLPLYRPNVVLLVTLIFGGVAGTIIYSLVVFRRIGSASLEEATEENAGSSFFNRRNPAILLHRADGLGYCPNLAHPVAWVLLFYPFVISFVAVKFIF